MPAQPGTGVVTGTVFDGATGQPIRQAVVSVEGVQGKQALADTDGKYVVELPAGIYALRFTAERYLESKVDQVQVVAGTVVEASTVMVLASSVTKVEVTETVSAVAATADAMLQERKLAPVVSDGLSSEEIRKSAAGDAAGALQKVTGVSVVNNGYVYVRGLGERYSATMLNSSVLPTTEPEKRVVPLDLFPSELIDSIKILKTYTPDLPGEFSGGVVQMQTVEFPAKKVFRASTSFGYNSRTTANRFGTYPGGRHDYWGFDSGARGLPQLVPVDGRLIPGSATPAQLQTIGRSFANNWESTPIESMRPNQSFSLAGGGTFGRFGVVGAFTFQNRPQFQSEVQRYIRQLGNQPYVFTEYEDFNGWTESGRMGGVFNVAYKLNESNKLVWRNTYTHDTDKEARQFEGYDGGFDSTIRSERLRWIERGLYSTSIEGDHSLVNLGNGLLKWQFTYSTSSRNEPDLREVLRGKLDDGRYIFLNNGNSGLRFFNNLEDRIYEPQVDFSKPFFRGSVSGIWKIGYRGTFRSRDFVARRFRFVPIRSTTLNLFAPSNELFAPQNIRPDGFQITEFTRQTDTYDASMDIHGGYGMVDLALGPRWRVVGGVRFEDADIRVNTLDPFVPGGRPQVATLVNRDPMPAVNVIYALNGRQNLRFGYSRTVSRPDFRELSPFDFNNVVGGFVTQGNPNLVRATVDNTDARWEWFPGGNQVIAASFFVKNFKDPIETTILPSNDLRQSFVNAEGALNFGFELEARRNLGFLTRKLREFNLQGNFTFVDSNIRIRQQDATILTSSERPLLGQSRYIYNVITEWAKPQWRSNARFYVNWVSRRISDVGTFGVPDIYQESNTFIDFVYQLQLDEQGRWAFRFDAENLADNRFRWTQGPFDQRLYQLGRTMKFGVSFTLF